MNPFDAASPLDARYYLPEVDFYKHLHPFTSEAAQVKYLARVESALAATLADIGACTPAAAAEIAGACDKVTPEEAYEEERRIQHNIRALVNCIRRQVSSEARPYVHLFATSADIIDTARALCLKEATFAVLLPDLANLQRRLIRLARDHADTLQIGRTHGQHAVPITFGFAMALYVSRLGQRIEAIVRAANNMRGKFAGAVGAYNALALFAADPAQVEARLMDRLGLAAPEISSQVVQPEYVADYVYALASCWGVMANLADDGRNLQRSELRELRDRKAADPRSEVVGSSTMPHKVNPKDFENVKSLWKAYVPRLLTVLMDQVSEHQRDLTNSASMRFVTEFVTAFAYGIHRLNGTLDGVEVDVERMREILEAGKDPLAAEPLYVLLSLAGHPDAHEQARILSGKARIEKLTLTQVIRRERSLDEYLGRLTEAQRAVLDDPALYVGAATQRTLANRKAFSTHSFFFEHHDLGIHQEIVPPVVGILLRILVPVGQKSKHHVTLVPLNFQLVEVPLRVLSAAKRATPRVAATAPRLDHLPIPDERSQVRLLAAHRVNHVHVPPNSLLSSVLQRVGAVEMLLQPGRPGQRFC
jgi:adenylosuccinate lyase